METLAYHDISMVIKFGVQFGLWGNECHVFRNRKAPQEIPSGHWQLKAARGAFAMTETGHEDRMYVVYRRQPPMITKRKKITIHTPSKDDGKEYIGNAALHGQMATVFAKLIIDDTDYGVNAFVVPTERYPKEIL